MNDKNGSAMNDWQQYKNLGVMWISQVKKYGDNTFIVAKQDGRWRDFSWNEIYEETKKLALGLMFLGVSYGDAVAIFSKSRMEWIYSSLGILMAGARLTCIYHTDSSLQCEHILTNSDSTICICEEQEQLDKILEIRDHCPYLKHIIVFERYEPRKIEGVIGYNALLALGEKMLCDTNSLNKLESNTERPESDDPFAFIYTSGTTGFPKGAIITHGNTLFCCWSFREVFPIGENDLAFCFLPLAHAGGLTLTEFSSIAAGCPIAVAEDMMNTAMEDMYETEPTWMFCTPRLYEKVYNSIMGIIEEAPWFRKYFILTGLNIGYKISKLRAEGKKIPLWLNASYNLAYFLVFRRVRDMFGGKMKLPFTGGAPIARKIIEFFDAVGMPLIEVFGQTETCSIVTTNRLDDYRIGSVGKPLPGAQVRLADDGEIEVYGPQVCHGYYKEPEASQANITKDGWLMTGDLGQIDDEGYYYIVDRKKYIMITAAGKNVAPQNIENLLKTHRFISQAIVYGDGMPYLIALLTLDESEVIKYARDNRIIYTDFRDLTRNRKIIDVVWDIVQERNRELARVEQIKKIFILEEELFQDDEEVTPTMKVKKSIIEKRYGDIVKKLYKLPQSQYTIGAADV